MMEFLNLKELVPLTLMDIDVDLQELRGLVDDSDSSVSSSEVLTSHYPVKPRKTLASKREFDPRYEDYSYNLNGGREANSDQVEEALAYIKAITTSRKDLAELESTREELELLQESYELNYQYQQRFYLDQKQEYASYFRALQGMFLRKMKSYLTNRTYYLSSEKLREQLVEIRQCNTATADAISSIKSKVVKPKKGSSNQNQDIFTGNNPLAVRIIVPGANNKEVVIAVGQRVLTPYGAASVSSIDNLQKKATLALGFGQLYATLAQLVIWVVNIEYQFQNTVEEVKAISAKASEGFHLQSFFLPLSNHTIASSNAVTGNNGADTETKDDASWTDNANISEMDVVSNTGGEPSLKDDGASEDLETLVESTNGGEVNSSSSNGHKDTATGNETKDVLAHPVPQHVARIFEDNQRELFLHRATLPLAPIDALPAVIADFKKREAVLTDAQIAFDLGAAQRATDVGQRVTSRLIPHDHLKSEHQEVTNNVRDLQAKERMLLGKLEQLRSEGMRLSSMTSNIRLGMFTRRIAHRNYLNSKGFATNLFLPTGSSNARGGFKGNNNNTSGLSSSSAASALLSMSLLASAAASAQVNHHSVAPAITVKSEGKNSESSRRSSKGKAKAVEEVIAEKALLSSPIKQELDRASDVNGYVNGEAKKRGREDIDKESENNESNGEDTNTPLTTSQKKKARRRRY